MEGKRSERASNEICPTCGGKPRQGRSAPAFRRRRGLQPCGAPDNPVPGARMDSTRSDDGTPIRYFRRGHGPAILLIHGTAADHSRWAPVLPALQRHFTLYAMDRRGRGGSGDAAAYRMDDEFADVAAVAAVIDGGPVDVVGHSYGGICAMESVFRDASIRRLVLYEPPIAVLGGGDRAGDAI